MQSKKRAFEKANKGFLEFELKFMILAGDCLQIALGK